uniref:pro-interleukin-16-like n=1 Tax=Pristiophorus japonicus TaxID=55135 RepID=UPI00398E4EA2
MESGGRGDGGKGPEAAEPQRGGTGAKVGPAGALGLTASIRRRCEGFARPKRSPGGEAAGEGEERSRPARAGQAEGPGAGSTSAGPRPERRSAVLQKIHSFEQSLRQRHAKRSPRGERPTKTPAADGSGPSSGSGTAGTANDRQGRSNSVSSLLRAARAQWRRVDAEAPANRRAPAGPAEPCEDPQPAASASLLAGHRAPSDRPTQSAEVSAGKCRAASARPRGGSELARSEEEGGRAVSDRGSAERPAVDSASALPHRRAPHAARTPPAARRGSEASVGRDSGASEKPPPSAAGPRRLPEASSQSLPPDAGPAPRAPSPRIGARPGDLGEPGGQNEADVLRQTVSLGLPATSSLLTSWADLNSSPDTFSPFVRSDDECSLSDESVMTTQSDVSQLDKSYSISLAELRECGLESREDVRRVGHLDQSASLRSNVSFISVVSLIPNDELERLLDEVKCLEEETLQCAEDIQVVVLHKEEGAGLGFSIAGGVDHENKMVTAHKVFPNGLAAQEGTIQQGDEILSINGNCLKWVTHSEALGFLHRARPATQAIVVARRVSEAERDGGRKGSVASDMERGGKDPDTEPEGLGESVTVELMKNNAGLGFSLDGGKSSSQGDKPLTIKKVFPGGSADRTGLIGSGDHLMRVGDESCQHLTCYEAWNLIKALPEGPVAIVVQRRQHT